MHTDPSKTPVNALMTKDVEMVHSEHTISQAAKVMKNDGVGSVVVMKEGNPAGIVTERDFVTKVAVENILLSDKISKIMTSPVIHVVPDEPVSEASKLMVEKKIRKIPVSDKGKITGIITATDILRFFRFFNNENEKEICPLHPDTELIKTELSDGTFRKYCYKCEEFFQFDE